CGVSICVLEPTKDEVLKQFGALKNKGLSDAAVETALAKIASRKRHQPLHNVSRYTFTKLIGDGGAVGKAVVAPPSPSPPTRRSATPSRPWRRTSSTPARWQ